MSTPPTPIYNPNVPEGPSSSIGQGQIDFLKNFMALYNAFAVDHVALDAATDAGNHKIIDLLQQSSQFQTNIGEISVYCKGAEEGEKGTENILSDQIFFRYQGNQDEFQFTNYQIYSIDNSNPPKQFFTFLPGRVIIYFGLIAVDLQNNFSIPFNLFPAIAINIITMNFCPVGTIGSFPPTVEIQEPDSNGIYKTIILNNALGPKSPTQLYYSVMANI